MSNEITDVSIDLETLSTRANCAILSIGAVAFNRHTGKHGPTFYKEIDLDSTMQCGHVSGSTLTWWMQQSQAARELFSDARRDDKVSLATALDGFAAWYRGLNGQPCPWGNGSSFDITALEHAYVVGGVGLQAPWYFDAVRDMRTIVDAAGIQPSAVPFEGVKHKALDDARHQANVIYASLRKITAALELLPSELARAHSKPLAEAASVFAKTPGKNRDAGLSIDRTEKPAVREIQATLEDDDPDAL
jgi:hypothetical protein